MDQHVALIRGINVGKAKRVVMAELKSMFEELGFTDVATVLNSGNIVFTVPAGRGAGLPACIADTLHHRLGVRAGVIVISAAAWRAVVEDNPMNPVPEPSRFLVVFPDKPSELERLGDVGATGGSLQIGRHAVYIWCPDGVLKSRVAADVGKALHHRSTARNWATVLKLMALLDKGKTP